MTTDTLSKGRLSVQELLQNVNSASVLLKDGQYIDCNSAAVKLTGYPDRATFLNSALGDVSPDFQADDRASAEKLKEMIALAFEKGSFKCNWTILRYDKTALDIEITLTPLFLDGEQYLSLLFVDSLDKTRKDCANAMQLFIEKMGDPYITLKGGVYTDCNQEAVDLFGWSDKETFLNKCRNHIYPLLQPDGCNSVEKALKLIEVARQNGSITSDWTYNKCDGTVLQTLLMMTRSIIDGQEEFHLTLHDVTEKVEEQSDSIKVLLSKIGEASLLVKDNIYIDCNQAAVDFLGYPDKQSLLNVQPGVISPLIQPDGRNSSDKAQELLKLNYDHSLAFFEWTHLKYDGTPISLEVMLTPIEINNEAITHVIWRDITKIKRQEQQILESEQKYKAVFDDSADAMLLFDGESFVDCNDAAVKMFGCTSQDQVKSLHPSDMSPALQPDGRSSFEKANEMSDTTFEQGSHRFEWEFKRSNGDCFPVEVLLTVITIDKKQFLHNVWRDITDKKAAEKEIHKLACEDSLTKLANRRALVERLTHVLVLYERTHNKGALLFIDLDRFKIINDTLGHNAGDNLLQQVAKRLTGSVRDGDTVSRFGGDEFVVMLENLDRNPLKAASKAEIVCEKLLSDLNVPYLLNGKDTTVSASIGVTMFTEDSAAKDLLQQSDIAMYQAKASGRNAIQFFDPIMQQAIDERAGIEQQIKDGLSNRQFELHYQLQVDKNGQALGAEALLRLKDPAQGYVPPMDYIPIAEETGLIIHIGRWVLETACEQLKRWKGHAKTSDLCIAVNVSPLEFKEESFVENVLSAVRYHDINPQRLKLELTETMMVDNVNEIILKMTQLKKVGIQFSMDDFGTGYSSLQYLRQLPLDQLKIDQSFVRDLEDDPQDRSIVQTIIAMGKGLGLDVIAEGVENTYQQKMLFEYGCHHYQGYLFAKPLPIAELEKSLS